MVEHMDGGLELRGGDGIDARFGLHPLSEVRLHSTRISYTFRESHTVRVGVRGTTFISSHSRAAAANLDYAVPANPLPTNGSNAGAPISGIWRGQVEAPETLWRAYLSNRFFSNKYGLCLLPVSATCAIRDDLHAMALNWTSKTMVRDGIITIPPIVGSQKSALDARFSSLAKFNRRHFSEIAPL